MKKLCKIAYNDVWIEGVVKLIGIVVLGISLYYKVH